MANIYHHPDTEIKEFTINVKVNVEFVGNHPCCGGSEDLKKLYNVNNGTGHVDYAIQKHLEEVIRQSPPLVKSDIFDVFKITVD